ncbi:MAG: hypothetical protein KA954_01430 [Chitinophagales bacterium]|nr:hypothetical protein [Chitinophagales bacterium]MBP9845804.1 hypothetical protein [Saprospiraceae bacterium]
MRIQYTVNDEPLVEKEYNSDPEVDLSFREIVEAREKVTELYKRAFLIKFDFLDEVHKGGKMALIFESKMNKMP